MSELREIRNRVLELRLVKAQEIEGAPWNWRTHPDKQQAGVVASLEELGIIDPLKCWVPAPGRLMLFDGHLRRDILERTGPDTLVPVVVTDLSEEEARKANLVFDPLTEQAEADREKLAEALAAVEFRHEELAELAREMAAAAGLAEEPEPEPAADETGDLVEYFHVLVECQGEQQQRELLERLEGEGYTCRSLIA